MIVIGHQLPDLRAISREELLEYGRRGYAEDIVVSLELIRRYRERHPEFRPSNVVPFRRNEEGGGKPA